MTTLGFLGCVPEASSRSMARMVTGRSAPTAEQLRGVGAEDLRMDTSTTTCASLATQPEPLSRPAPDPSTSLDQRRTLVRVALGYLPEGFVGALERLDHARRAECRASRNHLTGSHRRLCNVRHLRLSLGGGRERVALRRAAYRNRWRPERPSEEVWELPDRARSGPLTAQGGSQRRVRTVILAGYPGAETGRGAPGADRTFATHGFERNAGWR